MMTWLFAAQLAVSLPACPQLPAGAQGEVAEGQMITYTLRNTVRVEMDWISWKTIECQVLGDKTLQLVNETEYKTDFSQRLMTGNGKERPFDWSYEGTLMTRFMAILAQLAKFEQRQELMGIVAEAAIFPYIDDSIGWWCNKEKKEKEKTTRPDSKPRKVVAGILEPFPTRTPQQ